MKSYTTTAFVIALQIWLAALCCNTFIGSFILSNAYRHHFDFWDYAFFGAIFGSVFSLPIFIIVWVSLYRLLKAGYSAIHIFKFLLIIGLLLALTASALFAGFGGIESGTQDGVIFFLAPASGAAAIFINYHSIRKACQRRDEADMILNQLGIATEEN